MALQLDAVATLDLAGAGLLVAVGVFVLVNAHRRAVTIPFFLFAGFDAAATILFRVGRLPLSTDVRLGAEGAYWWFQILALAALAAFGLVFPRPFVSTRVARRLMVALAALAAATIVVYVADRDAFWIARTTGSGLSFGTAPAGTLVQAAYGAIVAALLVRITLLLRRATSHTQRDEASLVFAGIALAYAPAPATRLVVRILAGQPFWTPLENGIRNVAFLLVVLATVGAAIASLRLKGRPRYLLLGSTLLILLLTLAAGSRLATSDTLQTIAVFVGPIVLAYAILRYAVFDIDERVRRAATVAVTGAAVAAIFIVAEGTLQNILQDRLLSGVASGIVATAIAGILAAGLMVPIVRLSQRLSKRVVPPPEPVALHERKREIYRHALEAALVDGITDQESRILARLRASLGISEAEHHEMVGAPSA
ncbi:MAG TPA: hypothetical protein VM370_02510 [Candidatus Thermoplasmatota archaeon]|nr:hypothetical protein [Candidatus Thermoplasmatota archaeon]